MREFIKILYREEMLHVISWYGANQINSVDSDSLYWNWADGTNPKQYKFGVKSGLEGNNDCGVFDKTGKLNWAIPCATKLQSFVCECRSKECTEPYVEANHFV
jgi:hypothetical protein